MVLENIYRSVIMDHSKYKRNFRKIESPHTLSIHYKNPTCGDIMTLFIDVQGNKIKDASFVGEGCSISMASSSIMTVLLKNKTLSEVEEMRKAMEDMIRNGTKPKDEILGDAISLMGVHSLKARHNCALMPWQAFEKMNLTEKS
ncbi:SUF system NifU family Fe-S cluster assembly protein [Bacillus subtilis]|nr:SUF system NifU family Fe-S cluster assembly protein [Bacillus subtilis]MCM3189451.1 SUF system NifU family Fe-S cluster assembly protein [Bacillus subtilis]NDK01951.1 Nitrogen fixation protein [Bacillus subtilis subsp. subtilis]